jgi:hypothetical protein
MATNFEFEKPTYWDSIKQRLGELRDVPANMIREQLMHVGHGAVMNPNARPDILPEALPGGAPGTVGATGNANQQALIQALLQQRMQQQPQMPPQQPPVDPNNPAGIQF